MLEFLWILILYIRIHQAKVINITNISSYSNITSFTCPSSESCEIICFAEQSCNNMDIFCIDNDNKCSIHCSADACQNTNIYFINAMQSEVICASSDSSTSPQTCRDSQIYIEPNINLTTTVLIDIQSQVGFIDRIQINYKGNEPFSNDQIIDYLDTIPIYPISILCRNNKSCRSSSIIISSVNYFKLYCLSETSCYNLHMDFISHNDLNRGALDIICNGSLSCYNAKINAITAAKFEMICDTSIDSCSSTSVQCPIHSTVQLTDNSCILHCNDNKSCSFSDIYAIYGMIQLNNLNKNPLHVANVVMHCGYDLNRTCIIGQDCDNICIPMQQTEYIQMVLPFNENETQLQCDHDTDICVIFITTELIQSVHCGYSSQCMVICMDYIYCGGSIAKMIINGSTANVLRLQTLPHAYFQFADIYGPMNGEFISNAEINEATFYLSGTKEVEMICSSDESCSNLLIFANESNTISITCNDPFACQFISVFVSNNNMATNRSSPLPYCHLYWHCNDGCVNNTNKIVINTPDTSQNIQCDIYTLSNEWYCNKYALSADCVTSQNSTDSAWIPSTQFTYDNTQVTDNTMASNAVYLSSINDVNYNVKQNANATFLSQAGGLFAIGMLVICCCCCIAGLLITKTLVQKKITNAKKQQKLKAAKQVEDEKKDTGTTIEDIIKESASLPFTNPLEVHVIETVASQSPPAEDETRVNKNNNEQIALQYSANGWSASRNSNYKQRHSNISIGSNYVYGHPPTMTVEGSTDVESRINRYSADVDTITMSFERSRSPKLSNLTPPLRNNALSTHDVHGKQRTFSSPSLVVMSIYENGAHQHSADGPHAEYLSSSEDSDGMYDSMHSDSARAEGNKPTTGNTKGCDVADGQKVTQSTS